MSQDKHIHTRTYMQSPWHMSQDKHIYTNTWPIYESPHKPHGVQSTVSIDRVRDIWVESSTYTQTYDLCTRAHTNHKYNDGAKGSQFIHICIHMCDRTHSHVRHDSFTRVPWLIYMCDMTHLRVWHDSFTWVTWLIYMCDMTQCTSARAHTNHKYNSGTKSSDMTLSLECRDSFTRVTSWLIHTCDMTHSTCIRAHTNHKQNGHTKSSQLREQPRQPKYRILRAMTHSHEWHDSFTCVTRLISNVWRDSFSFAGVTWRFPRVTWLITHESSHASQNTVFCVTWLIHTCDMTLSHVWHDSFPCVAWLIHVCDTTHSHVWHDPFSFVSVPWRILSVTWLITRLIHEGCHDSLHASSQKYTNIKNHPFSFVSVTWLIHGCAMAHYMPHPENIWILSVY